MGWCFFGLGIVLLLYVVWLIGVVRELLGWFYGVGVVLWVGIVVCDLLLIVVCLVFDRLSVWLLVWWEFILFFYVFLGGMELWLIGVCVLCVL